MFCFPVYCKKDQGKKQKKIGENWVFSPTRLFILIPYSGIII